MSRIDKVLYTGKTHTTGGRDGASRSSDGRLDIKLSPPGSAGVGTNPEQLFAAGWSACFIGAIGLAAGKRKVALPADLAVDAEVDLGTTDGAYSCRHGCASAFRVSLANWRRASSRKPTRPARTRRRRAATSTWSSASSEQGASKEAMT